MGGNGRFSVSKTNTCDMIACLPLLRVSACAGKVLLVNVRGGLVIATLVTSRFTCLIAIRRARGWSVTPGAYHIHPQRSDCSLSLVTVGLRSTQALLLSGNGPVTRALFLAGHTNNQSGYSPGVIMITSSAISGPSSSWLSWFSMSAGWKASGCSVRQSFQSVTSTR